MRTGRILLVLLILLLGISSISIAQNSTMEITIITEEWPPYNYLKDGELRGFSTEIVQTIIEQLDLDYEIELLPGARGEKLLAENSDIMSFSLFRTASRENLYKWIGPIAEESVYFYKKAGSDINIQSMEDAKNVPKIACPHKGLIYDTLLDLGFTNLDVASNPTSRVLKVAAGRVDLGIDFAALGIRYFLNEADLSIDTIELTKVILIDLPLYIACSKNIPDEVIQQWQDALDDIKATGLYDEIYQKYWEDLAE